MARKRATRNTAAAKKPQDVSPEEQKRREAVDLYLKDFDKQIESRIAEMEREAEAIIRSIQTLYKVELIKLPQSTRNMKWDDYVAQCQQDGSNPTVLSEAMTQVMEDVRSEIDPQIIEAKTVIASTAKKRGRQPKLPKENMGSVRQSARKAPSASASRVLEDSSNIETPSTRGTRGRNKTVEETPATAAKSSRSRSKCEETPARGMMPIGMGRTPMITPKFNMATPLCRTVSRVARANEVLVSMSGSPVQPLALKTKAAKAEAANNALIPLGKGQTLNLPIGSESGGGIALDGFEGELDDEAMDKLAAIHASLGNMLKLRAQSSSSTGSS